jgi:hypothetical protein
MRRIFWGIVFIILLPILTLSLVACSLPGTNTSQPSPTITATNTVTNTVTATITATLTPGAVPPSSTTPPAASQEPGTPVTPQLDIYRNADFFITQDIIGYTKTPLPDGTLIQSPISKDVFIKLDLGGFFTAREAVFVPEIPTITDYVDWFFSFDLPIYKPPWTLNWGYIAKSNTTDTDLSLFLFKKDVFKSNYASNQASLLGLKLNTNRITSEKGINSSLIRETGNFTVLLRANNTEDIAGWWVKIGGQKYGEP